MSDKSFRQNEALIGLLARSTLGVPEIYDLVTKNKKNPAGYLSAYNSLRGTLTVTDAAKMASVSPQAMGEVLSSWETQGIVYDVGDSSKPEFHRLLKLPNKRPTE